MQLKDELKQLPTAPRDLRRFGLLVGGVFALLTIWFWFRGKPFWPWTLIPAVPLLVLGAAFPKALRIPYLSWMTLALILGLIVSTILLTIFYYVVITPMGMLARIVGKDFLNLKLEPHSSSYWIRREPNSHRTPTDYERQY